MSSIGAFEGGGLTLPTVPVSLVEHEPSTTTTVAPVAGSSLSFAFIDLPEAGGGEQTDLVVADLDGDGRDDVVVAARPTSAGTPKALTASRRTEDGSWEHRVIDGSGMRIEAGGTAGDVDGDGDLDLIFGGDWKSTKLWWYENPGHLVAFTDPWTRRVLLDDGVHTHHDIEFGDVDNDGSPELLYWSQGRQASHNDLHIVEVPANPRTTWTDRTTIFNGEPGTKHEGLAIADIDRDGTADIVAANMLLTRGSSGWDVALLGSDPEVRVAAGDLIEGGWLEIVQSAGDHAGELVVSSWDGSRWTSTQLESDWINGHSLDVIDIDGDGDLDIHTAEMTLVAGDDARHRLYLGDGQGGFTTNTISTGRDNHQSTVGDVDGDGDLDIVSKPFRGGVGVRVGLRDGGRSVGLWSAQELATGVAKDVFVRSGDLDDDGDIDLVTGGSWYSNPGASGGAWQRNPIGAGFGNIGLVTDLDGDGDLDLFGTAGTGATANGSLRWARNDGSGGFSVQTNLPTSSGDFLQGVVRLPGPGPAKLVLSWHKPNGAGTQLLTAPASSSGLWTLTSISSHSGDEDLAVGDIDRDGDIDVVTGSKWLERRGNSFAVRTVFEEADVDDGGATWKPDRIRLADLDVDGDLDVVITYERIGELRDPNRVSPVDWFENVGDGLWFNRHLIGKINGGHSLDVADMNGDGRPDVVVGEHSLANADDGRVVVFANPADPTGRWPGRTVHRGMEHHDGTIAVDLDSDGDRDIATIGWTEGRLVVIENPRR